MPNPRNRFSRSRRDKRRTHDKAEIPVIAVCKTTGEAHRFHHAYWNEGSLYYKGKLVIAKKEA